MPIKFFGRGSAFADEHNSAFFVSDNDLVLIDCPATAFHKVKKTGWQKYDNIFVLVTHTHEDHVGGIGTLIPFVWFMSGMKKRVTVAAPSQQVKEDLRLLLGRVGGCEDGWYDLITADETGREWFVSAVPTIHSATLKGRCFGYQLSIGGRNVLYTGDTSTLAPFIPRLSAGSCLYTEISCFSSGVHLFIDDTLPQLMQLAGNGVEIYLMHLDDEQKTAAAIEGTGIHLAPLYSADDI